jgi:YVTN family beta-propeller protein
MSSEIPVRSRQAPERPRSLPAALTILLAGVAAAELAVGAHAQSVERPVRAVTDPGVVTTRQAITPAGVQSVFDGRVYGVAFGASASELWVLTGRTRAGKAQLYRLDWLKNAIGDRWELEGAPALQGLAFDPRRGSPLVGLAVPPRAAGNRPGGAVRLLARGAAPVASSTTAPGFTTLAEDLGRHLAGGPAFAAGRRRAVLPLVFENKLAIVDADSGQVEGRVKTGGVAPFGAAISRDGDVAWVSHWGGRWPKTGDPTLPTGTDPAADRVVVDDRGIASTGTVARIDLGTRTVTATVDVGLHPTTLAWDEPRRRLYVANANSDSISVVDTAAARVTRTIPVKPFGLTLGGVAPTALAITGDGATLYAALGGFNAVAVIATADGSLRGLIPTAWYPTQLALTPDGSQLAVATLLGVGSGAELKDPSRRHVHAYRGTVHVVPVPDAAQLASYTMAVAENNHVATARAQLEPATARTTTPTAVPRRAGEPSLIDHVVYIIKENRTYDQLFGDLPRGNGEPSFVLFGEDVAPNHRKLATEFVLLDNFYATGGNSGDGHQWVTQASETSYALWPGYVGRSYPFDGTDPIAYANTGFLWDLALARNKTVRVFGEYAGRLPETDRGERERLMERWRGGEDFTREWSITAPLAPLNMVLARNYPPYTQNVPDVVRARIFLKALDEWKAAGTMPNLVVLQLPSDHTRGATPEFHTAKAMVADNDLALGQIVEALSASPFWKKMAILVVEDDAQNGVDHVDGHRTVALAISPYARRQHVDSTFYAHQSMVKTIELMLGLPTLSLFDLIAIDMRASFTDTPDPRPFTAVVPTQSLSEKNPRLSETSGSARVAAQDSLKMRWDVPDAVPTARLNRIVWGQIKGWHVPYPGVKTAVFAPLAIEDEADEADEDDEPHRR